ncbi:MAG TPA: hypothetical protein VK730_04105 [Solirubrobacteraceae bacterium]|nr:hypothetical protein [Solirubrobacteraceae bacterium]
MPELAALVTNAHLVELDTTGSAGGSWVLAGMNCVLEAFTTDAAVHVHLRDESYA